MSALFPFFSYFWNFKPCNTKRCLPLKTLHILLLAQILYCVLWKYCQDILSITSSYMLSCFYLPWFDSEILDITQYHDSHHKLDTLPYLSSHCLLSPLWQESGTCALLIYFTVLMVSLHIDHQLFLKKKKGLLTRTSLSWMTFVRSVKPGSLIWTPLIFFYISKLNSLLYAAATPALIFVICLISFL